MTATTDHIPTEEEFNRTESVLADVKAHRAEQDAQYWEINQTLEDGTGEMVRWLSPFTHTSAVGIEADLRAEYETHDKPTWMHLVREEISEAFAESDPVRLRAELIQVAALCVSWVETLDVRSLPPIGASGHSPGGVPPTPGEWSRTEEAR